MVRQPLLTYQTLWPQLLSPRAWAIPVTAPFCRVPGIAPLGSLFSVIIVEGPDGTARF